MSDEKETEKESKFNLLLDELVATLKQTKGFVLEQAPDVAQQMVASEGVKLKFDLVEGIVRSIILIAVVISAFFYPDSRQDAVFLRSCAGFLAGCAFFVWGNSAVDSAASLMQLKVAPKVYLLNKLREMMK